MGCSAISLARSSLQDCTGSWLYSYKYAPPRMCQLSCMWFCTGVAHRLRHLLWRGAQRMSLQTLPMKATRTWSVVSPPQNEKTQQWSHRIVGLVSERA
eukprot:13883899-Alexandrium_andersonii.AAC.1